MFGRPSILGAATIIVSPDDLIEETIPTKDTVEENLAIMDFAIVSMKVERTVWCQDTVGLPQSRLEKSEIIIERIVETFGSQSDRFITATLEPCTVSLV